MCEVITKNECQEVLRNYTNIENVHIGTYKVLPLSDSVEGFIGEHYLLDINYSSKPGINKTCRLFLKVIRKMILEETQSLNVYEKEEFHYNFLLTEYKKNNIDVSYAPSSYYCKPYKMVLDDLSTMNFKLRDKYEMFNLSECKAVLATLSKFHSACIIYERKTSTCLLDKYGELLEDQIYTTKVTSGSDWLRHSVDGFIKVVDHLKLSQSEKDNFKANIAKVLQKACAKQIDRNCLNTILHADLWTNNFLFKYENGKAIDSKLVDYQCIKYGPPASDVMQMIRTNTNKQLRDEHLNELLSYYYGCFAKCFARAGLDCQEILTMDDFLKTCMDVDLAVTLQAISGRTMTFASNAVINESLENDDTFKDYLFEERCRIVLNSYLTSPRIKEILEEDLLDFMQNIAKHKDL